MRIDDFAKVMYMMAEFIPQYAPNFKNPNILEVWYSACKDSSIEEFKRFCKIVMASEEKFPSLPKFLKLMRGEVLSSEEVGQEVAAKIEDTVGKCGQGNPRGAASVLGEFAWAVVQMCGGWHGVSDVRNDTLTSARKQWRDAAVILHKRKESQVYKELLGSRTQSSIEGS